MSLPEDRKQQKKILYGKSDVFYTRMCHKMYISTKMIDNKLHMNAELLRQQRRRPKYFEKRRGKKESQ